MLSSLGTIFCATRSLQKKVCRRYDDELIVNLYAFVEEKVIEKGEAIVLNDISNKYLEISGKRTAPRNLLALVIQHFGDKSLATTYGGTFIFSELIPKREIIEARKRKLKESNSDEKEWTQYEKILEVGNMVRKEIDTMARTIVPYLLYTLIQTIVSKKKKLGESSKRL